MSPVVERVARAIAPKSWAKLGTGDDSYASDRRRVASLRQARAAIDAYEALP